MEPTPARPTVVDKVVAILDALSASPGRLGLSELSRASGVPKSSVHRICRELAARGLVDRVGDGWCLGPKLFELGQRVPARRRLRDVTLPFLEDLNIATRQTVHLAVLEHDDVLYVEKLAGRDPVATPSEVAGRMPLHCTATGKCLLAYADRELVDRVIAAGLPRYTAATIRAPAVLREQLDEIRLAGVAIEREELVDGFASVAAPIFGLGGGVMGAIAVTTTTARFRPASLVPLVADAAAKATARFWGDRGIDERSAQRTAPP